MANLTESQTWERGVYQLETTDPILGGPNGIANTQAKQLANRTAYLKQRADQVDAAKAGYASLDARLDEMDLQAQALGIDMQDMSGATLKFAIDMAELANTGVNELKKTIQQSGTVTITNRGVITGCALSKNISVARNLDITAGSAFVGGQTYRVFAKSGAASVPINEGTASATVKAYLVPSSDKYSLSLGVTSIGADMPSNAIQIYNLTIPAGNTGSSLDAVTLTSVRRIESSYPVLMDSEPSVYVALPRALKDAGYQVTLDVLSASGGNVTPKDIVIASRASNGFSIKPQTVADNIVVNWKISHLNH